MKFKGENSGFMQENTVFLIVFSVICFLVSSSVIPFLGSSVKPDILLCLCCVLPKFSESKTNCIFALSLGFLSDLFINTPWHFSPVIYLISVVFVPHLYGYFKRIGTVTAAVCSLPFLALKAVSGAAVLIFESGHKGVFSALTGMFLPELTVNFAFAIIIGYTVKMLLSLKRKL